MVRKIPKPLGRKPRKDPLAVQPRHRLSDRQRRAEPYLAFVSGRSDCQYSEPPLKAIAHLYSTHPIISSSPPSKRKRGRKRKERGGEERRGDSHSSSLEFEDQEGGHPRVPDIIPEPSPSFSPHRSASQAGRERRELYLDYHDKRRSMKTISSNFLKSSLSSSPPSFSPEKLPVSSSTSRSVEAPRSRSPPQSFSGAGQPSRKLPHTKAKLHNPFPLIFPKFHPLPIAIEPSSTEP